MDRFVVKANAPSASSPPQDMNWEEEIQFDPGKRKCIEQYRPNQKDLVRRKYLANGPSQPRTCDFQFRKIGGINRRFNPAWFDEYGSWIEYSESKHRAYCLCCFLFRGRSNKGAGYDAFVVKGWNTWNKNDRLKDHVGGIGSVHNQAMKDCENLLKQQQHIDVAMQRSSDAAKLAYYTRVNGSVDVARLLLKQGLAFRGHDESKTSLNKGNFLETHDMLAEHNIELRKALSVAGASKSVMLCPEVQKDQDIVNAMKCVKSTRSHLVGLREHGWEPLLDEVFVFCDKHDLEKLEMEEAYVNPKNKRKRTGITNKHHFQVDCFNDVLDWLVQELDGRFTETTSNLLVWSTSLSPRDSFHDFNSENLISLAKLYPKDFDSGELRDLSHHLCLYIADVQTDERFSNIQTIVELSRIMVETRKHLCYPLVYRLLKLVLVLPVATATVERCFSAMKIVKTYLRNRLNDESLSDNLICYVEKEEMKKVTNDPVVDRFMKKRGRKF